MVTKSLTMWRISTHPYLVMSQHKFSCPHCQQHLQCDEQFSGREIQCPTCHMLIHIPPVPGKTAQFKPEAGKTWATYIAPSHAEKPKLSVQRKSSEPKPPA
jgi:hypothetical protein